jgi:phage-related protein
VNNSFEKTGNGLLKLTNVAKIAGAAITTYVFKEAISEGAKLEQSIGGIETLFKDSSDKMMKYANDAYKTAGLSANDYMEQATSFAASLLQSLDGDTSKAADAANQAVIDMSDNANKMGTSIELIQNAYQGFAKQNFTMLDNLKLGYGGTKEEMQRLLDDAEKISGIKYDISNLNDVYSAIHVIQKELGITGTTAKEASQTVSGSFASMKAAYNNLLGAMALGEDIKPKLKQLITTTKTFLINNLIPMILNIAKSIPSIFMELAPSMVSSGLNLLTKLANGFVQGFPSLLSNVLDILQNLGNYLSQQAPIFIEKGFELLSKFVDGIINALPVMISKLPQVITTFANIINDNFPVILMKGFQLLWQLIKGILSAIPDLIANMPQIIEAIYSVIMAFNWLNLGKSIIDFFTKGIKAMVKWVGGAGKEVATSIWNALTHLPQTLFNLGKSMISKMGNAITNTTGTIRGAIRGVFNAIINGVKSLPSEMLNIGKNLVKGLWNGISDMTGWVIGKIRGFGDSILGGIKDFFGIHSPSRLMRDAIGKFLPQGIAIGFEKEMPKSMKKIDSSLSLADRKINTRLSDMSMNLGSRFIKPFVTNNQTSNSKTFNQTNNFYQKVETPDEYAKAMRLQNKYGLAGV